MTSLVYLKIGRAFVTIEWWLIMGYAYCYFTSLCVYLRELGSLRSPSFSRLAIWANFNDEKIELCDRKS